MILISVHVLQDCEAVDVLLSFHPWAQSSAKQPTYLPPLEQYCDSLLLHDRSDRPIYVALVDPDDAEVLNCLVDYFPILRVHIHFVSVCFPRLVQYLSRKKTRSSLQMTDVAAERPLLWNDQRAHEDAPGSGPFCVSSETEKIHSRTFSYHGDSVE